MSSLILDLKYVKIHWSFSEFWRFARWFIVGDGEGDNAMICLMLLQFHIA